MISTVQGELLPKYVIVGVQGLMATRVGGFFVSQFNMLHVIIDNYTRTVQGEHLPTYKSEHAGPHGH